MKYILWLFTLFGALCLPATKAPAQQVGQLDRLVPILQSNDRYLKDMIVAPNGDIHVVSIDICAQKAHRGNDGAAPRPMVVYNRVKEDGTVVTERAFDMHWFTSSVRIGLDTWNQPFILYAWEYVDLGSVGIALLDTLGNMRFNSDRIRCGIPFAFCVTPSNTLGLLSPFAAVVLDDQGREVATKLDLAFVFEGIGALSSGYIATARGIIMDAEGHQQRKSELLRYSVLDASLCTVTPERQVRVAEIAEASVDGVELESPISVRSGSSLLFFSTVHNQDGSVTTYRVRFDERGEPVKSQQKTNVQLLDSESFARSRQPIQLGLFRHDKADQTVPSRGIYFCGVTPEGNMFYKTSRTELKPIPPR